MLDHEEISKFFKEIGLNSDKDRKKILSQGVVFPDEKKKSSLWIELDSVTNPEIADGENARLEPASE